MELADFEKMEQIRSRVDEHRRGPGTAEALKPYYRQFCKRPCFHDEYLDTLQPAERHARRHRRPGRRAHHRARRRGERRRVRGRLPDLRHRVRGRHRRSPGVPAASCIGRDGITLQREVGGRHVDLPRHARPRLPERVHLQHRAVGVHGELPAHARRAGPARRLHPRARAGERHQGRSRPRRRPRRRG